MLPLKQSPGRLANNVMHFVRVLRNAGMAVGSDRTMLALQALRVAGLQSRQDLHSVLAACLLDGGRHRELFNQAFDLFWRDPDLTGRMRALLLPQVTLKAGAQRPTPENRRLAQALFPHRPGAPPPLPAEEQTELHAELTFSERELLQKADFDTMSSDEWRQATRLLAQLRLVFEPLPTRRFKPAAQPGRAAWRATLAQLGRSGGELWAPRWQQRRTKPAPVLVLADISGSMARYSRMLLHFAHTLARSGGKAGGGAVESFVFGTRLTRITRLLKNRDPDVALAMVVQGVQDWSGGTRITHCLQQFNQQWARRVLSGNTTVLLISDGLEHDHGAAQALHTFLDAGQSPQQPSASGHTPTSTRTPLGVQMQRLHQRCRRLVWLNPLLRFDGFEPRAAGVHTMLAHVDAHLPCHNLHSLADLVRRLADARPAEPIQHHPHHATQQPTNLACGPESGLAGLERHHAAAGRDTGL